MEPLADFFVGPSESVAQDPVLAASVPVPAAESARSIISSLSPSTPAVETGACFEERTALVIRGFFFSEERIGYALLVCQVIVWNRRARTWRISKLANDYPLWRLSCEWLLVRTEMGLAKAVLARLVNLSPSALAKIENGGQTGIEVIEALAKVLNVSPAWLAFSQGPRSLASRRRPRIAEASSTSLD